MITLTFVVVVVVARLSQCKIARSLIKGARWRGGKSGEAVSKGPDSTTVGIITEFSCVEVV